jgi:hypothetical protein
LVYGWPFWIARVCRAQRNRATAEPAVVIRRQEIDRIGSDGHVERVPGTPERGCGIEIDRRLPHARLVSNVRSRPADVTPQPRESVRLGRSDMASRLPLTFALVLSASLMSGLTAARAADPAFCRQYTQAALNQARAGLSNPRCAGGLQGARWSSDTAVHYEWCLGASFGAAGAERDARTQYLRACRG